MTNLILNSAIFLTIIIYSVSGSLVHLGDVDGKSFYEENSIILNWTEAYSYCVENGMHLAKIESRNQADFLESVLNQSDFYWVSSKLNGSAIKYSFNRQGVNLIYSVIWTESGDADAEQCANFQLWSATGRIEFSHGMCSARYPHALCEYESNSTVNSLTSLKRPERKRNLERIVYQNLNFTYLGDVEDKSFYLHSGGSVDWEQAYQYCQEGNMTLAKIESEAQANFLAGKLDGQTNYWIALKGFNFLDRPWTYNTTGAFFNTGTSWATDGRVDDPNLGCGTFFLATRTLEDPIMVSFLHCFDGIQDFLCHVDI